MNILILFFLFHLWGKYRLNSNNLFFIIAKIFKHFLLQIKLRTYSLNPVICVEVLSQHKRFLYFTLNRKEISKGALNLDLQVTCVYV